MRARGAHTHSTHAEARVAGVRLPDLVQEALVAAARHLALVVQLHQQARGLGLHHVQHVLVVHKLDLVVLDALCVVGLDLQLEDVVVKVLLQLFIAEVDA